MQSLPGWTDVLIVGAGPTGLTLGGALAGRGIPFLLVDRAADGANTSRAAVVHARTLEVLESLGVSERLRGAGRAVPRFSVRDRDRVLATVGFDGLPTRYPYALLVPQDVTEAILLARLRALGRDVARPWAATALRPEADAVAVELVSPGSPPATVRARYVVGADGMHGAVREAAGIGFPEQAYLQSFVLADVRMVWPLPGDEVMLFLAPGGLVVVAPLPGGRHRIVATLDEAPEHPDRADVQRLIDARGPARAGARVEEVVWSSRFRVHHGVADRFRAGRVLIAGDAAHVHSPAGGQGMNTGIQDAVALAAALGAALGPRHDEGALDAYAEDRRRVARRVVAFTDRMTRAATLRGAGARSARNVALRLAGRLPPVRRRLARELAELRSA
jgi:2-polyprenyl-6-methoxyphenol hydroxylase-like FAD-dependent oxidoreductase